MAAWGILGAQDGKSVWKNGGIRGVWGPFRGTTLEPVHMVCAAYACFSVGSPHIMHLPLKGTGT